MATLVNFQGLWYATSIAEAFYGTGSLDIVSYEKAPTSATVGDYDVGVTVDLANTLLNTGWAYGDKFYFGSVERIVGSQHTDFLYGDALANFFDGGGSPDFIYGRDGTDTLLGSGGFDFLYGGNGNDVINGQQQTDTLYGEAGDDRLEGGSNYINHYYPGTNYADVLYGGSGNDQLHGDILRPASGVKTEYNAALDLNAGSDELHGGVGADSLNGDGGNDKLWGDADPDRFVFDRPYTVLDALGASFPITPGDDLVMDFRPSEGDRLSFSGQAYSVVDTANGIVITLGSISAPAGHVTLSQVHTFSSAWVV